MLRKFILSLSLCATLFAYPSCSKKDCKIKPVAKEVPTMQAYATANSITALPHSSGLYYEIINPGSGAAVNANSKIVITYVGKLMNGQIFDQQITPNNTVENGPWPLSNLIDGWKIGIPLIKAGGEIKLLVPSALAYGCEQYYDIPGNSVLYFDIQLVDVQ